MVAEGPAKGTANSATATSVRVHLEVPDAGRAGDDDLAHAHDEGVDPEEHEELVDDDVARVVLPLDLSQELVGCFTIARLAHGEDEDERDEPDAEPDEGEDVGEEWKQEDAEVLAHILSSGLVHSDTDANGIPAAADAAEEETTDAENYIRGVLDPVAIVITLLVVLMLHVGVNTGCDDGNLEQDDGEPDDDCTAAPDDQQVKITEDNSSDCRDGDELPCVRNICDVGSHFIVHDDLTEHINEEIDCFLAKGTDCLTVEAGQAEAVHLVRVVPEGDSQTVWTVAICLHIGLVCRPPLIIGGALGVEHLYILLKSVLR